MSNEENYLLNLHSKIEKIPNEMCSYKKVLVITVYKAKYLNVKWRDHLK